MNGGVAAVLVESSSGSPSLTLALVLSLVCVAVGILAIKANALEKWIDSKQGKIKNDKNKG